MIIGCVCQATQQDDPLRRPSFSTPAGSAITHSIKTNLTAWRREGAGRRPEGEVMTSPPGDVMLFTTWQSHPRLFLLLASMLNGVYCCRGALPPWLVTQSFNTDVTQPACTTVAGVFTEPTPGRRDEDLWVAGSGRGSVSCNK